MPVRRALLLCSIALLLWPERAVAQAALPPQDQVVLAGSVVVARGQRVGEVVVFSGRAAVHGVATGDVVVLEGPVTVTGQVNGSVIAADGPVRLEESARVGGDVFSSGRMVAAPGAKVGGETRSGVRFSLEGPLAALGKLLGPVSVSVSVLLTGLVLLLLAPRGADAIAEAIASAPLASLGWGIILAIGVPVASVALAIAVLGLPLGLSLLLSLGLWWIVGLTWAAWCAGRGLVRAPHGRAPAFVAGWAIVSAVGLVPVLDVALWTIAPTLGVGAMLVAAWRAQHGGGGRHARGRRRATLPPDEAIGAGTA